MLRIRQISALSVRFVVSVQGQDVAVTQVTAVKTTLLSGVRGIIPEGRAAILLATALSVATQGQF